jgi:hypothetical protein
MRIVCLTLALGWRFTVFGYFNPSNLVLGLILRFCKPGYFTCDLQNFCDQVKVFLTEPPIGL